MRPHVLRVVIALLVILLTGTTGVGILAAEKPAGSITGVVLDDQGHPMPQARVFANGPVRRWAAAQGDGTFRFDRLPVGKYNLQARARGYEAQWSSPAVDVSEDQTSEGIRFALSPRPPSLAVAQHQRVFTPGEPIRIAFRGTIIDRVTYHLYRLDPERIATDSASLAAFKAPGARSSQELVQSWQRTIRPEAADDNDWFYRAVDVPHVGPGTYRLVMDGETDLERPGMPQTASDSFWFEVTNVALVAKRSGDEALAYAVDLVTRRPLPGVSVRAFDRDGQSWTATTDKHGLVRHAHDGDRPLLLLARLGAAPAHVQASFYNTRRRYEALVYTDRPVYRPGHQVSFKALIRRDRFGQNVTVPDLPVDLKVLDPQDNVVQQGTLRTNDMGSLNGDFTLSDQAPLGTYRISLSIGDETHSGGFQVQDYRKPEFKLDVRPEKARYVTGETAQAIVTAAYYFGAPVVKAKVHYTVYSNTYYPWASEEDTFFAGFDSDDSAFGYQNVVMQGDATTDDAGHVTLSIPAALSAGAKASADERYTIDLEAADASRQIVKGKGGFLVTRGAFTVDLEPDRYVYRPGEAAKVTVKARDYDDKPITTPVKLVLEKDEEVLQPDGKTYQTRTQTIATLEARTDAQGYATVPVTLPKQSGDFSLRAEATDPAGHAIASTTSLWLADESWAGSTMREGLVRLTFDKKRYEIGDVAQVLVQVPSKQVCPLLTVEGQRLFEAQVLPPGQTSHLVRIPVRSEYRPNAFVAAAVVDGKAFHTAERSLNVNPEGDFLSITVRPGQKRYLPGETARLTVETRTLKGRPVSAEVSLGVVDEAIYAIAPDETPDIRRVFHGPRWNRISTSYSFEEDYSGGIDKDTEEPRVRKNFKDTAAWFPTVRTGAEGKASVTFPLPDNLTTWVVTARGITESTLVGAAREKFLVSKDLLVRLATPRFLVMGDHMAVAAMVHNYTDRTQNVRLALRLTHLSLEGSLPEQLLVPANSARRLDAWLHPDSPGPAKIDFSAVGDGAGDALEQGFPVLAHGTPEAIAFAGEAPASSSTEVALKLPPDAVPGTASGSLSLAPTPLAAMRGALDYLRTFPYGCIEQTTSRFAPEIVAYRTMTELGLSAPEVRSEIPTLTIDGLRRITGFQNSDGGWGWFSGDSSEVDLTAYVLSSLHAIGLTGTRDMTAKAIAYLERQGRSMGRDVVTPTLVERHDGANALASILWALSDWEQPAPILFRKLDAHRSDLSDEGRALAALAYAHTDRVDAGRTLWQELKSHASRAGTLVHWESNATAYSWYDSSTETTAYALRAGLAFEPNAPEVSGAIRWLLVNRQGARWQSTKDTAAIVMALAEASRTRAGAGTSTGVDVQLDGQAQPAISFQGDERYTGGTYPLLDGSLTPGRHRISLHPGGTGFLPFSGLLTYVAGGEDLAAKPSDVLSVRRDYLAMDPNAFAQAQKNGSAFRRYLDPKQVAKLPVIQGTVKSHARVLVRLTLEAKQALPYLIVEDPLPAGAEILDEVSGGWSSQEARDDRMVFFEREIEKGTTTLYYVMRPELPGRYHALPTTASGMYAPEIRARGAETRLEIGE